jgi:phage terminase small subunit
MKRRVGAANDNPAGLNAKQRCFVLEYLVDLNSTQAAIRAGYSQKTADVIGPRLLGNVRVKEAVAKAVAERAARTEITADAVLKELAVVGFAPIPSDHVKVADKLNALALLGRHLGMFTERVEVHGKHVALHVSEADLRQARELVTRMLN